MKPGLFHNCSNSSRRSATDASAPSCSFTGCANPLIDVFSVSRSASKPARSSTCSSSVIGRLLSGVHQFAVRWNTVIDAASSRMVGTTCTPLDDVPTTATRLPVKSTGSAGHRPVWCCTPWNSSRPGTSGTYGTESTPVAAIR